MSGRIRTIKPELLEDERAAGLSDAAWRLFVSSWLLADDHGRFRAGGRFLAAQVWQDTAKIQVASDALAELAAAGRVRVYEVAGERYAEIPTWTRHQRIDNAGKPRIPPPPLVPDRGSVDLGEISPRDSASLGEPPRVAARAQESAALPPTSDQDQDLRSGPSDHEQRSDACEGEPRSGLVHLPAPERAPLGDLIENLVAEGNPLGVSVADRLAKGWRPTEPQLVALRRIHAERAQGRAPPRGGAGLQRPAGPGQQAWEMPEILTPGAHHDG